MESWSKPIPLTLSTIGSLDYVKGVVSVHCSKKDQSKLRIHHHMVPAQSRGHSRYQVLECSYHAKKILTLHYVNYKNIERADRISVVGWSMGLGLFYGDP